MNKALEAFLEILRRMGLRHLAVGSIASSVHGLARFTNDADLLVEIDAQDIARLEELACADFYFDPEEARRSLNSGRAFNLIHLGAAVKIDVFPVGASPFHRAEMERGVISDWMIFGERPIRLPVLSAEDTILSKLRWYQSGGQVSDRQWTDILGIATRRELDWNYINLWAGKLGLAELLARLRAELNG